MDARARSLIALLVMSILWGTAWTALKVGLFDAEPFRFSAIRMGVSALCLLAILPLTGRRFLPYRVRELVSLGLVQTSALFTLSTLAVAHGNPGRVAFLVYTMPFFTLLIAWPMLGERVRGLQWLAIVLAAAGLLSIIEPWRLSGDLLGNSLAIGAGIAWGLGAVMVKRLQNREPMDLILMTAWQMVFGSLPLIALAYWVPEAPVVWSMRFLIVLFFVSVIATAFGWLLWVYALANLEAGTASLATLAAPVVAMATSAIYLGERPNMFESLGMVLITLALFVLSYRSLKPSTVAQN